MILKSIVIFVFSLSVLTLSAAEKFPLNEKDIAFGKTLSDFGVDDVKTVHAKDFGFNPSNSTAFIQQALDSGATTVVIDAMPSPWRIDSVLPRSNQRILVKRGAKILMDHLSPLKGKKDLFCISKVKNVIIEGEGCRPDESYVGGYAGYEERKRHCKWYGKSAFALYASTNVVIRNLHIADSEEDGVFFGGLREPSVDTYLEDLDITSHYRQACSICCADGVFIRRVTFRDTRGNEPSAGIDIEPAYPCSPNTRMYLFDCVFANNNGGGIVFATCSDYPIRFYAKGCRFLPNESPAISIPARGEAYVPKQIKADVKIIFEDTEIESYSNVPSLSWNTAPLFSCWFTRLKVKDSGKMGYWRVKRTVPPFNFTLDRDYGPDGLPPKMNAVTVFKDVTVEGFKGQNLFSFRDELGKVSVKRAFRGNVLFNSQTVNTASFSHEAPDLYEPRLMRARVKDLLPPTSYPTAAKPSNASISWNGAWYQALPEYTYFFPARKGATVSFNITYPHKIVYEDMTKKLAGKRLMIDTPSGVFHDAGPVNPGVNKFTFTAPEDGWYSFLPPCQDGEGNKVPVTDVVGTTISAYQSDTNGDSLGKFVLKDTKRDYRGYFEVPPNVECKLRITWGELELYDAEGKLVDAVKSTDYLGRYTFKFRSKSGKHEIWSFRTPPGGGTRVLKFYAPLNGLWADSPDDLPRMRREGYYFDWNKAKDIARGIKVFELFYDQPRLMKAFLMRVDLKTPGIRFTGTERAENFGEPMPDVTNRVVRISTRRERTEAFMKRRRAEGHNVVAAFNTAPWTPWEPPFTHRYAHLFNLQISDGKQVSGSSSVGGATLVIWKDGSAAITNKIAEADFPKVSLAHSGFSVVLRDGVIPTLKGHPSLAPRTAGGLSEDGRYLYILTVDGRQKKWSQGADMRDLALILSAAGADDAMNFDGGGSTTLVVWDEKEGKPFIFNRHGPQKGYYRPVALNAGIILPRE